MNNPENRLPEARMEIVTATFVAAGMPAGLTDLGRVLERLNHAGIASQIELHVATVRPLYRSGLPLELQAPMLVRRDDVIFVNFEGPDAARGAIRPAQSDVPVLLLAPPFQIQGDVPLPPDADPTEFLSQAMHRFFVVGHAKVFDAEGTQLGEGEQIVVNGAAVVMTSMTRDHIPAIDEVSVHRTDDVGPRESGDREDEQSLLSAA